MAFKRRILEAEAQTFFKKRDGRDYESLQALIAAQPELTDYSEFRAVMDRQKFGWNHWPARLRDGKIQPSDYDSHAQRYHLYAQWRVQQELAEVSAHAVENGQALYLDLPLGLHAEGFDIWRDRDLFVSDASGGAPPDPVFTTGQNWQFPPMHPEKMRLRHHDYTIGYVRNHLRYARLLRIDHVMGLHRLFWIPKGLTGDKGVYVEYPAEELYAILSLRISSL